MRIAIPLFEQFTALDAVGPYEVLSRMPGAEVVFVAENPGPHSTDTGALTIVAGTALSEVDSCDVLVVPGGPGTREIMGDVALADWVRRMHDHDVDDFGLHGVVAVGRGRPARRLGRHDTPGGRSTSWSPLARTTFRSAWCSRARSSLRRVCRPASTWPDARGGDRGTRSRTGNPAVHRVRPAAALRHGIGREGAASHG